MVLLSSSFFFWRGGEGLLGGVARPAFFEVLLLLSSSFGVVETDHKRRCQSVGSSGVKRKMEHAPGDDQMQMEAVDIQVMEVQTWMSVMSVEGRQMELEDCRSSFVEEREWDPQNL